MLMELIENGDLRDMLDNEELNKTLTIKMKIRILRDIAEAMKYLYEQNPPIEHRDLKVSSIGMYSERGNKRIGYKKRGAKREPRRLITRLTTPPPHISERRPPTCCSQPT
jgi:serine/threonine protein kinase